MKDLQVWGFCWYPYPGFCECEGWVVSRHSVQSFIAKQLSTDHGPLSHIPFRGWIQSFFCSLSPSFLIYGANIYSELLWACCWNAERIRDTGASLARCGLWETRERWVFRKGEWSGGILSQSLRVWRLKDAQRLCGRKVTGLSRKSIQWNGRDRNDVGVGKKVSGGCSLEWWVKIILEDVFSIKG